MNLSEVACKRVDLIRVAQGRDARRSGLHKFLIDGKYLVGRKIGAGTFGEIYVAQSASGRRVAVKLERMGIYLCNL